MKFEKIREAEDIYDKTVLGFARDLSLVTSYHGVKTLMRKHFRTITVDNENYMEAKVDDELSIQFELTCKKSDKVRMLKASCWCLKHEEGKTNQVLIWQQEKKGREPFSAGIYFKDEFFQFIGVSKKEIPFTNLHNQHTA